MIDLVIVPFHDCKKWLKEGFRTRDAHLFEQFQKNSNVNKILVVNRPVSLAEVMLRKTSWRTKYGELLFKKKNCEIRKIAENIFNIDFFELDFFRVFKERKGWWFSAFNKKSILDSLNQTIKELDLQNTVLFLENPMAIGVAQNLKFDLFVFDAIDNWLQHPQMNAYKEIIKRNYQYINDHADVIFTVSQNLKQLFQTNKTVHWVSNGVDTAFFEKAFSFDEKLPIVGYVGKIQERIDFDLLEKCLIAFPKVKFQILGPIYSQKKQISLLSRAYSNVDFLGDIHYSKLPHYMQKWNVAIIPHRVDSFTASMNPLKLYEYLASGKPVVSTEIAGVSKNVSPFVYVAKTTQEFISILKSTLENTEYSAKEIACSIPIEYQWSNKASVIIDKINSIIG